MYNSSYRNLCPLCGEKRKKSATAPPDDKDPDHPGLTIVTADTFERYGGRWVWGVGTRRFYGLRDVPDLLSSPLG